MRALLLTLALAGCVPVTLDRDPPIDFERWRAVYVAPIDGARSGEARDFAAAMQADSGFTTVTTNPNARVDAVLYVRVDVDEDWDAEDQEYDYDAVARVRLESALDGRVLDTTTVDDGGDTESEAVEDALDEVVQRYLRPYRL